jgi:predicted PilT family ATPase
LDGVNLAKAEIEAIVKEKAPKKELKISDIPFNLYPFISGPKNANISQFVGNSGVSLKIPFLVGSGYDEILGDNVERDILIVGDQDSIEAVRQRLVDFSETIQADLRELMVTIPKRRHRFLVGNNGAHLKEIFETTGCFLELPPVSDPSEYVKLRGLEKNLGIAFAEIMKKANSAQVSVLKVQKIHPKYDGNSLDCLYRYLSHSGLIRQIEKKHSVQIHLPQSDSATKGDIEIVSKESNSVNSAISELQEVISKLAPSQFDFINVPVELHYFLAGKDRSNVEKIKSESGVVVITSSDSGSNVVLYNSSSDPSSISKVKKSLLDKISAHAEIAEQIIEVSSKYFKRIAGPKEANLHTVLGQVPKAWIKLGNRIQLANTPELRTLGENEILIRGSKSEVEKISKDLAKFIEDAKNYEVLHSYTTELTIPGKFLAHVIGKNGAHMTKYRDTYDVKIDIDKSNEASKGPVKITVQGFEKNANTVKKQILELTEKLNDQTQIKLNIPSKYHRFIIGPGGKYVHRLEEKYGVFIKFPSSDDKEKEENEEAAPQRDVLSKDEILVKGGKKGVSEAQAEIIELVEYEKENSQSIKFVVSRTYLPHILGKGGVKITDIKDETSTKIDVDNNSENSEEATITVTGSKANITKAQKLIMAVVKEQESIITQEIEIPNRIHRQLIGPGASKLRQLVTKALGSDIDVAQATSMIHFPKGQESSDIVKIKGQGDLVEKIATELQSIAKELESIVTDTVQVDPSAHASVIGKGGSNLRALQEKFNVEIKVPAKDSNSDLIKISGKPENIESAKAEILAKLPHSSTFTYLKKFHHQLAGHNNFALQRLRRNHNLDMNIPSNVEAPKFVNLAGSSSAPRIDDDSKGQPIVCTELVEPADGNEELTLTLSGSEDNLKQAVQQLEKLYETAKKSSHALRIYVPNSHHRHIIGTGGKVINEIRRATGCEIELPQNGAGRGGRRDNGLFADGIAVVITGPKDQCYNTKEKIVAIVNGAN